MGMSLLVASNNKRERAGGSENRILRRPQYIGNSQQLLVLYQRNVRTYTVLVRTTTVILPEIRTCADGLITVRTVRVSLKTKCAVRSVILGSFIVRSDLN
jgi:hypothetical protein